MRLGLPRPELDDPDPNQPEDEPYSDELEAELDPEALQDCIAGFDPYELAAAYRLRPPPRHQRHSPWIIAGSVIGVALGLTIWVGVLTTAAGGFTGYVADGIGSLAPQLHTTAAVPAARSSNPAAASCADESESAQLLHQAGIWFAGRCSGG